MEVDDQAAAAATAAASHTGSEAFHRTSIHSSSTADQGAKQNGVTFKFEPKPMHGHPPLYLSDPSNFTASTDAGDYRLYVGGSANNGAFRDILNAEQGLDLEFKSRDYVDLHRALLNASRAAGNTQVSAADVQGSQVLLDKLKLAASFGQVGIELEDDCKGFEGCNGSVFIHVFDAQARPLHEKNVAMLYVVGPKGEGCTGPKGYDSGPLLNQEEFLSLVTKLGRLALEAIANYNRTWATSNTADHMQLPKIEELRWCLVSGGVYRHINVGKVRVAKATLDGMMSADCADLIVTFTYELPTKDDLTGNCFFRAYNGDPTEEEPLTLGNVSGEGEVSWNTGWTDWVSCAAQWSDTCPDHWWDEWGWYADRTSWISAGAWWSSSTPDDWWGEGSWNADATTWAPDEQH